MDLLAKLDMEKGGVGVRLEQQRSLCRQLASTLVSLRQVKPAHQSQVTKVSAELNVSPCVSLPQFCLWEMCFLQGVRSNLDTLEKQRKSFLQSLGMQQEEQASAGSLEQNQKLIESLTSSVAKLKVLHAQKKSETEQVCSSIREKNSSLMVSRSVKSDL